VKTPSDDGAVGTTAAATTMPLAKITAAPMFMNLFVIMLITV
jgi:hypothetical protein